MCVICCANKERPTSDMVVKMFQNNPHGAGIAWREGHDKDGKNPTHVSWKKGLDLDEVIELCKEKPLPFVVHFRVPSCGGPSPLLTHPFPIDKDTHLALEGSTPGNLLFHNGHWGMWDKTLMESAVKGGWQIPKGKWSDSRAMAWMAAHVGIGVLEFINEKAAVFGPNELELFQANGWSKFGTGIWVSNEHWKSEHVRWDYQRDGKKEQKALESGDADKEEPQPSPEASRGSSGGTGGSKKVECGTKPPTTLNPTEKGTIGGTVLPFEEVTGKTPSGRYMSAERLWKARKIGKKSFRRARHAYEKWCKDNHQKAVPPPERSDRDLEPTHQVH